MKTILIASNVTGGLYEFRQELLEILTKDNRVIVLGSKTAHVDDLLSLGCEVIETPLERHGTNPLTELKLVSRYKKILKEKKYAKEEKNTGIMTTGIIGGIMALAFIVLLLVPIPMFNCSLGKESYICLIAWIVIGVIFYFTAKKRKEA